MSSPQPVAIDMNNEFRRALELIDAGRSVFITGRAGTGKSTLLNFLVSHDDVPQLVLAPTGVAALNVGGQTVHRFFGFPQSVTPEEVIAGSVFPGRNHGVIKTVRRIIIDEVSMMRADLMDCVDVALRKYGNDPDQPFGGIQMVFVGDPYQLPPVVLDEESEYFATHYQTPFFFSSHALEGLDFETVELERIYRQSDDEFIEILNAIRENSASAEHFDRLARNVDAHFAPDVRDQYITLTTTNSLADKVNEERLSDLEGEEFRRIADVTGEFPSRPNTTDLRFKVGAQVMLLTNDPANRWVNGSLGKIFAVQTREDFEVSVLIYDTGEIVSVEPHRWTVSQPRTSAGRLIHEEVGTFRQLPFALAWAITIHKSQGKTFEKVIVDIGRGTFSSGQLYVALSRARSLDGIVLRQQVRPKHVLVEDEVARFFARRKMGSASLANQRIAAVAVNVTGHSQFDRIVELAVVILEDGAVVEEFDTMVHPLRDVSASWEHGITASMASMAPSFAEVWAALAPALEGCVLVAHGLAPVARQIRLDLKSLNLNPGALGMGMCLREQVGSSLTEACRAHSITLPEGPEALSRARATAQLLVAIGDIDTTFAPIGKLEAGTAPPRLQRRPGAPSDLVRDLRALRHGWGPAFEYSLLLARALDDGRLDESEQILLDDFSTEHGLTPSDRTETHERFCASLVEAAVRDEEMTDDEWAYIALVHGDLGLEPPERPPARPDHVVELFKGMKVCFTGFPLEGSGSVLEFQALAEAFGLEPVRDVTKACHLVVAQDRASISNRAKKGRERGILVDVTQFIEAVESGELHDPPPDPEPTERARTRSGARPSRSVAPRIRPPLRPEELPKNRSIGSYSLEQLVSVVALVDSEKSLGDSELLNRVVEFLEFDLRSPQRIRKIGHAIDMYRGDPAGAFRSRQESRTVTAVAGDLTRSNADELSRFTPRPGMRICFTGAAVINGEKVLRKVLQDAATAAGLVVLDNVTADCNVLVFADENARATVKVKKALAMGIEGMTVSQFAEIFLSTGP